MDEKFLNQNSLIASSFQLMDSLADPHKEKKRFSMHKRWQCEAPIAESGERGAEKELRLNGRC